MRFLNGFGMRGGLSLDNGSISMNEGTFSTSGEIKWSGSPKNSTNAVEKALFDHRIDTMASLFPHGFHERLQL